VSYIVYEDSHLLIYLCSKRVFILGPSHHFYLPGCALTKCDEYETPLGNLIIDKDSNLLLYTVK
jgi:AmmeMemoRadiSam system protein B